MPQPFTHLQPPIGRPENPNLRLPATWGSEGNSAVLVAQLRPRSISTVSLFPHVLSSPFMNHPTVLEPAMKENLDDHEAVSDSQ